MPKEQDIFRAVVALIGKNIELGIKSTGEILHAQVINAMFDSLLISIAGKSRVIAFADISFLDEK